jgi:hypothetical protein
MIYAHQRKHGMLPELEEARYKAGERWLAHRNGKYAVHFRLLHLHWGDCMIYPFSNVQTGVATPGGGMIEGRGALAGSQDWKLCHSF